MDRLSKAQVAEVRLGFVKFNGVQLPDGTYGVAVPQIAELFLEGQNQPAKYLKRLMGNDFKTSKEKTEFNRNVTLVVSLLDFEKIVAKLDRAGNKQAQDFRDALIGLSLNELFNDAFGVSNTPDTRQTHLKKSLISLREELTLVHGGFQTKCVYHKFCARRVHDYATKYLVGRTATESINQLPINPEFSDFDKYSKESIGINHVNDDEIKFLESLITFKKYFSSRKPKVSEDWKEYTNRVLELV